MDMPTRLTSDYATRKGTPMVTGVLDYFPDALAAVSRLSKKANDKHNPGEPMHWARGKSDDHVDCLARHLTDRGTIDEEVDELHDVHVAWRALANLQLAEEKRLGLPAPRGASTTLVRPRGLEPDPVTGRTGDWITTHTGISFYPHDPRADEIVLDDIAHALAHQCRYAGHSSRFYSVAEHCVMCARVAAPEFAFTALMHDAAEAYLPDIPRPIKRMLPDYKDMERKIELVLKDRFDFTYPFPAAVHEIDNRMLCTEGAIFFAGAPEKWWITSHYAVPVYPDIDLECWTPERAKREFLAMFEKIA